MAGNEQNIIMQNMLQIENVFYKGSSSAEFDENTDYFQESCKLYLANILLTSQLKELLQEKNEIALRISRIEASGPTATATNENKKASNKSNNNNNATAANSNLNNSNMKPNNQNGSNLNTTNSTGNAENTAAGTSDKGKKSNVQTNVDDTSINNITNYEQVSEEQKGTSSTAKKNVNQDDANMSLEDKKRRTRRAASQIDRHNRCPIEKCSKSYGSEGSLQQHMRLKHPEFNMKDYQFSSAPNDDKRDGENDEEGYSKSQDESDLAGSQENQVQDSVAEQASEAKESEAGVQEQEQEKKKKKKSKKKVKKESEEEKEKEKGGEVAETSRKGSEEKVSEIQQNEQEEKIEEKQVEIEEMNQELQNKEEKEEGENMKDKEEGEEKEKNEEREKKEENEEAEKKEVEQQIEEEKSIENNKEDNDKLSDKIEQEDQPEKKNEEQTLEELQENQINSEEQQ